MSCKRTARRPPRTVRVEIDSLAFGGDGVARDEDGRVTFVPGTAPGDRVEAVIAEEKKGYARATLGRVIAPGASRVVAPPCALYERAECGGCQWMHVARTAQLEAKQAIVRRALRRLGDEALVRPIAAPSPDLGWRRRARLRLRPGVIGYAARRSHRLVDVAACPQLDPALEAALVAVREAVGGAVAGSGELHLLLGGGGAVHVALEGPGVAGLEAAAAALIGRAGIAGVRLGERVFGDEAIDLADDGDGGPFWARADLFAQVSAPGNATLRALVREAAGALDGRRVLELHAGSGNFTRDLAAAGAAEVVAVEQHAAAAALARRTLADRGLGGRVRFDAAPVAAALAAASRPDLVVLDPPRTGLAAEETAALAALAPPRLVYVSCDPETLARDLGRLADAAGYCLVWAAPVDLMPQTYHVEVVTLLER